MNPDHSVQLDNTAINIVDFEKDVLLTFSIRRTENAIVFNSRTANGNWGDEKRIPLSGVFTKATAKIVIQDAPDNFNISVDGRLIYNFGKRIFKPVTGATYGANGASVLSDPLNVTVGA